MHEVDIASLSTQVVVAAFVLGLLFGAIVQRTNFCTMGSIADIVGFGDWTRMRMWALAIAVAVAGTTLLAAFGLIDPADSFYATRRFTPLAYVLGGWLFGFGMVLAGGCGSKALVRAGAGSLKALVVVFVLGLVAYISLRGVLAVVRVNAHRVGRVRPGDDQDLPAAAGGWRRFGRSRSASSVAGLVASALLVFVLRDRAALTTDVVLGGVGVGAVIVAVWYVSGHLGHLAEHPRNARRGLPPNELGPHGSAVVRRSGGLDARLPDVLQRQEQGDHDGRCIGMRRAAGAAASSLLSGRFRWEGFRDTEDTANHLAGAALMGFGGVTAMGCTIGQGLSGVSMLAVGSVITLAAIVVGAVAALRYQAWRIEQTA